MKNDVIACIIYEIEGICRKSMESPSYKAEREPQPCGK